MNNRDIDRIVSRNFGVSVKLIHSSSHEEKIVIARAAAISLCRRYLNYRFTKLSKVYHKRSHNTSRDAVRNALNLIDTDKAFAYRYGVAAAQVEYAMDEWKTRKQKYNLHYRLRQKDIPVEPKNQTISIRADQEQLITKSIQLKKLLKTHNYSIQYSIV
jgi:hypothetical protein